MLLKYLLLFIFSKIQIHPKLINWHLLTILQKKNKIMNYKKKKKSKHINQIITIYNK